MIRAVKIYKKIPSQDGFTVDLDDNTTVEISDTVWNTEGNLRSMNDIAIFQPPTGVEISFTHEQINEIKILGI